MFDSRGWPEVAARRGRGDNGKRIRMSRIFHPRSGKALVVPMDHSVTIGPLGKADHADRTAAILADAGADAVIVHKGRARAIDPIRFGDMALVVHLSAGTDLAIDRTSKVIVGSVEECLRLGADAVSVHVNVGSHTEAAQLTDLGAVAAECDALGVPLLAMMYARGPELAEPDSVATLAHLGAIATDLGADIVKLDYAGSPAAMDEVVDSCPLPILVAGGPAIGDDDDDAIAFGTEVAKANVAGLSFGRTIFGADDPHRVAAELATCLHAADPHPLSAALESA